MLCKKNEKNCINATRRAPNRARHFFCLYAALVCGVCFALPAFADGDQPARKREKSLTALAGVVALQRKTNLHNAPAEQNQPDGADQGKDKG